MNFDYPQWEEPGSGRRQECQWCGKHVLPAIHSCNRVPLTMAARRRARIPEPCELPGYIYAADIDGSIFYSCKKCGFEQELGPYPRFDLVAVTHEKHRQGSRD